MTGIVIRQAVAADGAALAALGEAVAAQPLLQRYGVTPAGLASDLLRVLAAQGEPGAAELLVAEDGGALRGFARYLLAGSLGAGGYLQLIALRPGDEGAGLGAALLRGVEERVAAHSRGLFLLTSDFNTAAQRFYERQGYQHVGALPAFARPEITELLYWKRLR